MDAFKREASRKPTGHLEGCVLKIEDPPKKMGELGLSLIVSPVNRRSKGGTLQEAGFDPRPELQSLWKLKVGRSSVLRSDLARLLFFFGRVGGGGGI